MRGNKCVKFIRNIVIKMLLEMLKEGKRLIRNVTQYLCYNDVAILMLKSK
jgi:hypothetical protein